MAKGEDNTFVAVVNDTDPKNGGKSYPFSISGSDYNQFIGKKIGDVVEGQFVKSKESEQPLDGYKLEITGGCD